jgi:acyl transferase domain-containing protein/SAM-dependent methyltransferase
MLEILNRYAHGMVLVPFVDALRKQGCLEHMADAGVFPAAEVCRRFSLNPGYFAVAMRMLRSCGWIQPVGDGLDRTTADFELRAFVPEDAMSLYAFPYETYVRGKSRRTLEPWIERSECRWGCDHPNFHDYLDGVFLVPLLLALHQGRALRWTAPVEGGRAPLEFALQGRVRAEVERLLVGKRWAANENGNISLSPAGQAMLDRIPINAALASYRPMFANTATLLAGDPERVFALDRDGHEKHLDRTLNVVGSGFQHQRYFAALGELVRKSFDTEDLDAQPKYLADTGCGDGSLLLKLYDVIRTSTRRGSSLDTHPLTLIAIDWNEKALRRSALTLEGTPHLTLKGDIGNPAQILEDLRKGGLIDVERILHVRSFLDHDRPYIPPADADEAARRSCIGEDGVFVDRSGGLIPARDVVQSTVEHLRRWAEVLNDDGLIMLEVHSLPASQAKLFVDEAESLHFDAYHSMSRQFLLDARSFLMSAAEAGLFCDAQGRESFPKRMGFTRITLNRFCRKPYRVRHPRLDETATPLSDLRTFWRSERSIAIASRDPAPELSLLMVRDDAVCASVSWTLQSTASGAGDAEAARPIAVLDEVRLRDDAEVEDLEALLRFLGHYLTVDKRVAAIEGVEDCLTRAVDAAERGRRRWQATLDAMRARAASSVFEPDSDPRDWEGELAGFAYARVATWLTARRAFGKPGQRRTIAALIAKLGVLPKYHRYFDALMSRLAMRGLLVRDGESVVATAALAAAAFDDPDAAFDAFERGFRARHPHATPFLRFLLPSLLSIDDILSGRVAAAAIMFPDGDMEAFAGIFDGEPISAYFNALVAAAVQQRRHDRRAARFRVLEVGAGTGGTTLPVLRAMGEDAVDVEYMFTDVSPAFLRRAQGMLAERHPHVRYKPFDVERDPATQGFETGAYDAVIAANVLHDTRDIVHTLRQVRRLMAPGGALLITEYTEFKEWLFFSGGLLHGMWLFEDDRRRLHKFCLLDVPRWRAALRDAGFVDVEVFALPGVSADERCGHCVIACRTPDRVLDDRPSRSDASISLVADRMPIEKSAPPRALDACVREQILSTLGPERSDGYHDTRPLMQLGLDSVEMMELKGALGRAVGVKLPAAFLFENETPAKIAAALAEFAPVDPAPTASAANASSPFMVDEDRAVAVVGVACRVPGASTPADFWRLLDRGDCVIGSSAGRLHWPDGIDPQGPHAGIDRAGLLPRIDEFDADFFQISPHEAELMDPQQRLLLELSWEAIERAGYRASALADERTGVFIGACHNEYRDLLARTPAARDAYVGTGSAASMLANRLSFYYDFRGPSVAIDTACSSALVAMDHAVRAIRSGECAQALLGAVNLICSTVNSIAYHQSGMLSRTGTCRAFDRDADGFVRGEGGVVLLLKSLRRARADGDTIHCTILGTAIGHGGRAASLTAPKPASQAAVIEAALADAGIPVDAVQYIETHGTGTQLGDVVEIAGLEEAFRRRAAGDHAATQARCVLGSVKTNIGHLEGAAGLAGALKVLLAMRHRTLPASCHFSTPNPGIDLERGPFEVIAAKRAWQARTDARGTVLPRIAGVSSFGFGGVNAHAILCEAPDRGARGEPARSGAEAIVLSAKTSEQLRRRADALLADLQAPGFEGELRDVACTLQVGREPMPFRLGFLAGSLDEARRELAAISAGTPSPNVLTGQGASASRRDGDRGPAAQCGHDDLPALLRRWVEGADIDWPRSGAGADADPGRIELSGYPFARTRFWIEEAAEPIRAPVRAAVLRTWQWRPATPLAHATGDRERHVLLLQAGDESGEACAALEAALRRDRDIADSDRWVDRGGDPAERYERCGWRVVETIKPILQAAAHRDVLLQVAFVASAATAPLRGLAALLKTAALESPKFRGQLVELDGADDASSWSAQLAECAGFAAAGGVGLRRAEGAWQRPDSVEFAPARLEPPWKAGGVYLITGGAGGLGLAFAQEILTRQPSARIVLAGRSALRPTAAERIAEWTGRGASVAYRRADLAQRDEVDALVDWILECHGTLDGVLHAAATVRDGFLLRKTHDEYAQVHGAKARAAVNLDAAIGAKPLDFFVVFSSIVGATGNIGQCDYAAANAFLDEFAEQREARVRAGRRRGRSLSIAWPWLADGGLQVPETTRERFLAMGMTPLATADAIEAFHAAFACDRARVAVHAQAQDVDAGAMARPAAQTPADAPRAQSSAPAIDPAALKAPTSDRLRELLAEVTKRDVASIDPDALLERYGIDSFMIMRLNARLDAVFEQLSKTLFYEHQTLTSLRDHLVERHPEACARWSGLQSIAPSHPPASAPRSSDARADAPAATREPIAIIGMSGRFAGARDLRAFWENLRAGRDSISEIPSERWPLDGFHDPDVDGAASRGRSYGKWGGFVDGFAEFDAQFFGIAPRDAEQMDPQERLFLQTCWEAMEDAGYTRESLGAAHDRRVGVFVGATKTGFDLYGPKFWQRGEALTLHTSFASFANRVSYVLNLQGPSMPVDTMCSASLTALHEASEHLLRGECEAAFCGGVNLYLHPSNYLYMTSTRMLSPRGRCRAFGAGADGFVPGEGVGVVLLKRLSRALADRDPVHATILATSINHGGKTNGYTVPNPVAQRELVSAALERAGIDADRIGFVEAHGTGTELGDPIEITGLTQAFERHTARRQYCAIGSVKTNIGHCEGAAGMAGLIKIVLQMRHGELVPSLHAEVPNPLIDFAATPFFVQQSLTAWPRPRTGAGGSERESPRLAALSSFGAGGSNAHAIVEEYVGAPESHRARIATDDAPVAIVLSARSRERLVEVAQRLADAIDADGHGDCDLADIAYTLQIGREAFECRLALVVSSIAELRARLADYCAGRTPEGLRLGEIRRDSAGFRAPIGAEDMRRRVASWVQAGELHELCEAWVAGHPVDWSWLHADTAARRIPLPTYPFERVRYWIGDKLRALEAAESSAPPIARATAAHPGTLQKPNNIALPSLDGSIHPSAPAPEGIVVAAARTDTVQSAPAQTVAIPPQPSASAPAPAPVAARIRLSTVQAELGELLARALYMEPDEIDPDKPFADMGLDSIIGVEWLRAVNARYRTQLPTAKIYDCPTLTRMALFMQGHLQERADAEAAAETPPAARSTASLKADPAPLIASAPTPAEAPAQDATAVVVPPAPIMVASATVPVVGPDPLTQPIAIVGMSARYPQAPDLETFWQRLERGEDCVGEVPAERWDVARYYDPEPAPGRITCKWLGALQDVDCFDPLFFSISPAEAALMDPQQRLFLQEAYRAFEDAGCNPRTLGGTRCGVYLGIMGNEYAALVQRHGHTVDSTGNSAAIAASRISYILDLMGPAISIDTACSSSLVATHLACQALRTGEVDMALAGGVTLYLLPELYLTMCAAEMLSSDGRCRTMDNGANGFVPGEGVGALVLKRLSDAEASGDPIHGVIVGSGINQDGRTNGITAPNPARQGDLQREVYARYGIDPKTIGYVEMHGTGTRLGDPVELEALQAVYGAAGVSRNACALGSVKSNIGHTSAAAGVAGVHKVLLCMRHARLVPTLHFESPNEHFDFDESAFHVNTTLREWRPAGGVLRRAAVSSFGHSGTNAHLVIQEYPARTATPNARPSGVSALCVLSARTPEQLRQQAQRLAAWLRERTSVDFDALTHTLQVGREAMRHRFACVFDDRADLISRLEALCGNARRGEGCFLGEAKRDRDTLDAFSTDDDLQVAVEAWIAKGKHDRLLGLWVKGLDLDWQALRGGRMPRRISLPTYPFARHRCWVAPSPEGPPAPSDPAPPASTSPGSAQRVAPAAEPVPETGHRLERVPFGLHALMPCWDVVRDAAEGLPGPGAQILLIGGTPDHVAALRSRFPRLSRLDPADCGAADDLSAALRAMPLPEHVLWLALRSPSVDGGLDAVADPVPAQAQGVVAAFRLLKSMLDAGHGARSIDWTIVTRGAWRVHRGEAVDPTHAGLHGLFGSAAKEQPRWRMRCVDLSADDASLDALDALPASAWGGSVAVRDRQWYRQQLLPAALADSDAEAHGTRFRRGGVYVVIGGAGGIGMALTRHLIERYAAHVWWVGRRPHDADIEARIDMLSGLGPAPEYCCADATDREALERVAARILRRHGAIHGAIHSAIVLDDRSIERMDEDTFRRVLAAKVDVSVRMAQVFGARCSDFLLFFSSMQSWSRNAGQSNYAAGCTFKDGFAQSLAERLPIRVGIVNWGYWGSVGVVASDRYRRLMAEQGIGSIEPEEAMSALETMLAGGIEQLAFIRTTRPGVLDQLTCGEDIERLPSVIPAAHVVVEEDSPAERGGQGARADDADTSELERFLARLLCVQLAATGLWSATDVRVDREAVSRWRSRHPGAPDPGWIDRALDLLVGHGLLRADAAGHVLLEGAHHEADAVWREWAAHRAAHRDGSGPAAMADLVEHTLRALPDIMAGKIAATDVIFPDASMDRVAPVYTRSAAADRGNALLVDRLRRHLDARHAAGVRTGLRVIEIGAGTGGTSAGVLAMLDAHAVRSAEYCYTDLSPAFLQHGREVHGVDRPWMRYRRLDIEQAPTAQGFDKGVYDIVVAANVLHATRDIRRTLRHAKSLLRRNGLLLLNELRSAGVFEHLTFGLLEGWWRSVDPELRLPGTPALDESHWRRVLREEGFDAVSVAGEEAHRLQVIAAISDGWIRLPAASVAGAPVAETTPGAAPLESIGGEIERTIAGLLSRLTGVPAVELDLQAPLGEYGVDSILSRRLLRELETLYAIALDAATLLEHNSVSALAAHIAGRISSRPAADLEGASPGREAVATRAHHDHEAAGYADLERVLQDFRDGRVAIDVIEAMLDKESLS